MQHSALIVTVGLLSVSESSEGCGKKELSFYVYEPKYYSANKTVKFPVLIFEINRSSTKAQLPEGLDTYSVLMLILLTYCDDLFLK